MICALLWTTLKSKICPLRNSLGHHHLDELLVIDLSVTIDICLTDHLIYLLIGEFLSQICHDVTKLCSTEEAVAITVKDFEGCNQLFFSVSVLHLTRHQR